jgi:lipoprotein-releasing system permease protein
MLDAYSDSAVNLISNPKMVNEDDRISNPNAVIQFVKTFPNVKAISPQITANIICSNGNVQENGNVAGVNILEQDKMFDISSTMIAGDVHDLHINPNGIIIGAGMARNLNLQWGDNITLTASNGSVRLLRITGIFKTTIKNIDETRCYANVAVVQQLLRKDRSYITDVFINLIDYTQAGVVGKHLGQLTGYTVETWQSANEQSIAARMIRDVIANSVVITILIVAGFGIYNILNMMIYEKNLVTPCVGQYDNVHRSLPRSAFAVVLPIEICDVLFLYRPRYRCASPRYSEPGPILPDIHEALF